MRVIAGSRKGHGLKAPKGHHVRPTEGRVKESLFNILGPISNEAIVLDAFAGSGSIGIEFLSRGAKKAYFIDNSRDSIHAIYRNLEHTKLIEDGVVINTDIIRFLKTKGKKKKFFDYIYIDPPFEELNLVEDVLKVLNEEKYTLGLIIVEHVGDFKYDEKDYKLVDKRNYGGKNISFFKSLWEE